VQRKQKPRTYRQVLADIVHLCNSEPYTSSEVEAVEVNVGKLCDELRLRDIPATQLDKSIKRLRDLRNLFQEIGGPYAPQIRGHLTSAIADLKARSEPQAALVVVPGDVVRRPGFVDALLAFQYGETAEESAAGFRKMLDIAERPPVDPKKVRKAANTRR
jgi:hypothetical protein